MNWRLGALVKLQEWPLVWTISELASLRAAVGIASLIASTRSLTSGREERPWFVKTESKGGGCSGEDRWIAPCWPFECADGNASILPDMANDWHHHGLSAMAFSHRNHTVAMVGVEGSVEWRV